MMADLKLSLRTLRRTPGYTLAVVLTLALGIAATTGVFSVLRSVVLAPLPYAPVDRAVIIAERDSAANIRLASYPTFEDWRAGSEVFAGLAFVRGLGTVMKTGTGAERLVGAFVSAEFFDTLPEEAAVGRTLGPGDFAPGAPGAVVLSHRLWRRRFGGAPSAVGRAIVLGDRSYTIVGVMPANYVYPTWAELYAPITMILTSDQALQQRGLHVDSRVVGRLRPGVDTATAQRALSAVAAHLAGTYPAESGGWRSVALYPVASEVLGDIGPQLRLLSVAAAFVLLIACVNVANLSLARATTRSRELAIRTALGAGRGALLRLLAAESLVLGLGAGALGLAGSVWLIHWIRVLGHDLLPRVDEVAVDGSVAVFSVGVCVAAMIVFGFLPALLPVPGTLTSGLKDGAGAGTGRQRRRLRSGLVVAEFTLALMLLAGAGLLVRSLLRLQEVKTGFVVDHLLAVPINPPSPKYEDPERALALYRAVAEAAARVPGVTSVALTNHVPLSGASINTPIEVEGGTGARDDADEALFREVDSNYFQTAGIPIVAGRNFSPGEIEHPNGVVLVNQFLAKRYWPGRNPIGERLTVRKSAQGRPEFGEPVRATVVGVTGDVRHFALDADVVPEVYLPYTITVWPWMSVLVRVGTDPARAALALQQAVLGVEPDLPLEGPSFQNGVYQVKQSLRESLAYRRLLTGLLAAFAVPACLLAALGIYGVVAYLVAQREHELAVRVALGASRQAVLRLVLAQGLRLSLIGVGLGVLGALAGTRLLRAQLFEVSPTDPLSLIGAACALTLVGLLATYLPARRATGVDPMRALRAE